MPPLSRTLHDSDSAARGNTTNGKERESTRETIPTDHKVGSREEWLAAPEELLAREKELTRLGDELARQRRELPWVPVEKEYRFQGDEGATPRGLEFLMGYYPILDRAPKGRDEGDSSQLWIRRHDEYDRQEAR